MLLNILPLMWSNDLELTDNLGLIVHRMFELSEWSFSRVLEICAMQEQGNTVIKFFFFLSHFNGMLQIALCKSFHVRDTCSKL